MATVAKSRFGLKKIYEILFQDQINTFSCVELKENITLLPRINLGLKIVENYIDICVESSPRPLHCDDKIDRSDLFL